MSKVAFYRFATALIMGGFAMLCQPWYLHLFSAGFPVIVVGVIIHILLDHWPESTDVEGSSYGESQEDHQ